MYIMYYDGDWGRGETLKEAYSDLKDAYSNEIDFEDIECYEAKEVNIEMNLSVKRNTSIDIETDLGSYQTPKNLKRIW